MTLTNEKIDILRNYIENDEVVYQVCGELVEVANKENLANRKRLLDYFKHVSSVEVYQKGTDSIHDSFEELDNWATEKDVLFLLDMIGVLICISKKEALNNHLIAA